jgi:hypothetical protein
MGDAVGEGVRLPGSGAGDDKEGRPNVTIGGNAVLNRTPLLRIQGLKVWRCHRREHESSPMKFYARRFLSESQ